MSYPLQDAEELERPSTGGSIKRARERAEAGRPREDFATFARRMAQDTTPGKQPQPLPTLQPPQVAQPPALRRPAGDPAAPSRIPRLAPPAPQAQSRDVQVGGLSISRPTPIPQWPLPPGPMTAPVSSSDAEPYRPPPGKSQPPQRPPRPSRVPSILDGSKIQDHTPVFQYQPQTGRESELSIAQTSSRPSTLSSVASIPDFPLPTAQPLAAPPPPPMAPPRRSVNLGPPPSSRRGASSFYSHLSYVSPIPEESPRSRSHASYASSAAMPDGWGTPSPGRSPNYPPDVYYEDIPEEGRESVYDEDGDESRLVRSASIGKRGKASLVTTTTPLPLPMRSLERGEPSSSQRPDPSPVQGGSGPFSDGTGYLEGSSNSSASASTSRQPRQPAGGPGPVTMDSIMHAFEAASSTDPTDASRRMSMSPGPDERAYNRWSAMQKPPRLDVESADGKKAERGSLTNLSDMIRRATRLAASLERGRRPASRFDTLDYSPGALDGRDGDKEMSVEYEKHQSGLSDMLAAFPPPAQANRRSWRQSVRDQVGSWPLPLNFNSNGTRVGPGGSQNRAIEEYSSTSGTDLKQRPRRRCCGLPLWGFIVVVIVVLMLIAAAIVIPLEFFVIRRQNVDTGAQGALAQCQGQLSCGNGGINVVSDGGFCSCICTNGFTGFDCTAPGTNGCATTTLTQSSGGDIRNVTLGEAIPRLIAQANANFSIPLSGTQILAKFNAASLSCGAENALVTFDGQSMRVGDASSEVSEQSGTANNAAAVPEEGVAVVTVTVRQALRVRQQLSTVGQGSSDTVFATTVSFTTPPRVLPTTTTTVTTTLPRSSSNPAAPTGGQAGGSAQQPAFRVTEQVLDFARVSVLLVLQEQSLANAEAAQMALQRVFQAASAATRRQGAGVSLAQARAVQLGNGNTMDLVGLLVSVGGGGPRGRGPGGNAKRDVGAEGGVHKREPLIDGFDDRRWHW